MPENSIVKGVVLDQWLALVAGHLDQDGESSIERSTYPLIIADTQVVRNYPMKSSWEVWVITLRDAIRGSDLSMDGVEIKVHE